MTAILVLYEVEFSESSIPGTIADVFDSFLRRDITPVITHPERNALLMARIPDLISWIRSGCLDSGDGIIVHRKILGAKTAQANCRKLMDRKMVHFVASDAHDTKWRPPDLREARKIVTEGWGEETAELLFETYPRIALTRDYIDCEDPEDAVEKEVLVQLFEEIEVGKGPFTRGFLNFAAVADDAGRAGAYTLAGAADDCTHGLQIHIPAPIRNIVGVTDFMPGIADLCRQTSQTLAMVNTPGERSGSDQNRPGRKFECSTAAFLKYRPGPATRVPPTPPRRPTTPFRNRSPRPGIALTWFNISPFTQAASRTARSPKPATRSSTRLIWGRQLPSKPVRSVAFA